MSRKVVVGLTGGPCSGKTSAESVISEKIPAMTGFDVYTVRESATTLIQQGMQLKAAARAGRLHEVLAYEQMILRHTMFNIRMMLDCASLTGRDSLILVDRPPRDIRVYLPEGEEGDELYENLAREEGLTLGQSLEICQGVIKMTTAAEGAEGFYTTANNDARDETIEEARYLDRRTEQAYLGHPHLRVIDNSTDFRGKVSRVLHEICSILGVPQPLEIERKFLIRQPDFSRFPVPFRKVRIEQHYLKPEPEQEEVRVRRRSFDGSNWTYYLTAKRGTAQVGQRVETEEELDWKRFYELLQRRDPDSRLVAKDRYCFLWKGQYFELDVFDANGEKPLMEIELTDMAQTVILPDFVEIEAEVTGDKRYSNREIARRI
jgi:CYTH domain-containing protein